VESLNKLDAVLKGQRRIEKNASVNLAESRTRAREQMWDAHRLWNHLERHPNARQDELRKTLGGDQDQWRRVSETWEKMGVICRVAEGNSYRLSLATQLDEPVFAKCPTCGVVAKAPKAKFLDEAVCPKCHAHVSFVILPTIHHAG